MFAALTLAFITGLGSAFFSRGEALMQSQLRDQLRTSAAVAALQFDPAALARIRGKASMESASFHNVVWRLKAIRDNVPDIRFAYVMRRTNDPLMLEFVADADSLDTDAELDENGDGVIAEDEEGSYPGDRYDITAIPALQSHAFVEATADAEVTIDQWGAAISGYAPIRSATGAVVAVLGIDMDAADFFVLTGSIFSPVAFLLLGVVTLFFVGYIWYFLWLRRLETLKKIDEERSALMLLASHQLGTPLTIFQWSLESLKDNIEKGTFMKEIDRFMNTMQEGVNRLRDVLNELREATRIDTGSLRVARDISSLTDLIRKIAGDLKPRLDECKQSLQLDLPDELRLPLDRTLITAALRELLENSMQYSPNGSVIRVRCERHKAMAVVSVEDHGCGVPIEDRKRIFAKFVRGSNAPICRPDGNGLGLFIAKGIIERAGGDIRLTSVEGKGTTMTFTLPLE